MTETALRPADGHAPAGRAFTPAEISAQMRALSHQIIDRLFYTLDHGPYAPRSARVTGAQAVRLFCGCSGLESFATALGRMLAARAHLLPDCTDKPPCNCLMCMWAVLDDAVSRYGDRDVQRELCEASEEIEDFRQMLVRAIASGRFDAASGEMLR